MRVFNPEGNDYSWDYNPYYSPEKCGLELLSVIDEPGLSYEYNTTIVTKDIETGKIFVVSDSGCSCPTPFEWTSGLDKMTEIRSINDFDAYFSGEDWHTRNLPNADILKARRIVEEEIN